MSIFDIERLIKYGYFPKELPPCFSTNDLANQAALVLRATGCISPKNSIPLVYSGFKSEISRRKYAIPNPYHFCKAASEIVNGENDIKSILDKSKYSLKAPIEGKPAEGESYAMRSNSPTDTREAIENLYQNNRIEIRLDINSCFDSIYTHTIPWVIHGIGTAKKHTRDNSMLGNRLDGCMQAMNYGQTNGVLVGNDLSRIVSEIILCTVDTQIQDQFPRILCRRYVDDYYIYIKEASEIQQIIAFIRSALAKYQLTLNENKIQINESPFIYGKTWLVGMQQAVRLKSSEFLSWLISEYYKEKDPALLKYGLKVVDSKRYSPHNRWKAMQSKIINMWVRYPFLADRILPLLWNNKEQLKKSGIKNAIYTVVDQSILLGLDLELIWAIWFVKVFDIQISQEFAVKVLRSNNDLAKIILFDILDKNGLSEKPKIQKEYQSLLDALREDDLDDEGNSGNLPWSSHWLLAYELERKDRFSVISESLDIMSKNPFFMKLLRKDIKFYDSDYVYSDTQFEKTNKKTKRIQKFSELIKSEEFQSEIENGNQEMTEKFIKLIEEAIDVY